MAAVDLVTLAQVRAELELPNADTTRDSLISTVITQASRAIISAVQREFVCEVSQASTVNHDFRLDYGSYWMDIAPYDMHAITNTIVTIHPDLPEEQILVKGTEWIVEPVGTLWTFESIRFNNTIDLHNSEYTRNFGHTKVRVGARNWGFLTVPEDVQRAAIITVASNIDRRVDAFGFNNELADSDMGISPNRSITFTIPTAALSLLAPYRRHTSAF
jgi:hypothetical protein